MKLIFGLGNPGAEYENTYHNAGLLALGRLDSLLSADLEAKTKQEDAFWYKKYGNLVLAGSAPHLFMNQAGGAVQASLNYFKIPPENLIVLHDDSDLLLGEWKLEKDRGPAGHHGVESVIKELGRQDFWRGRIGIRPTIPPATPAKRLKAEDFVLDQIRRKDKPLLETVYTALDEKILFDFKS